MIRSMKAHSRQLVARELDNTKLVNKPGPVCPEVGEAQFTDWAKDAVKAILTPIFPVSDDKDGLVVKAPALNKRQVSIVFTERDRFDVIICLSQNEEGGAIVRQEFPTSAYAKYSALIEDLVTWVCDKLFATDRRALTPEQQDQLEKVSAVRQIMNTSMLSEDDAQEMAVMMANSQFGLPRGSAQFHLYTAMGLKRLAARVMQRLAMKDPPVEIDYKAFRRLFQQARGMLIKSLAHLMRSRDIAKQKFPARMVGKATIDLIGRFDTLEKDMLALFEMPSKR